MPSGLSSRLLSESTPQSPEREPGTGDPAGADVPDTRLSVVIVTHDSAAAIASSVPAIVAELRQGDELIVCDNASADGTPDRVRELAPAATVLHSGANLGFGDACNAGARAASGDLLLFLNPDAVVAPGFREAIELPLRERRGWDAWQGLVSAGDGELVNTWGGVVHFTGIGWAGGAGRPIAEAPQEPREIPYGSGACLAVRRDAWEAVGGFGPEFFLYHEDTDLGLRLWLAGFRVGLEPRARCEHDYEFHKGTHKWYFLERNRYAMLVRTYPAGVLLAVLPALLASEPALLLVAARGGWLREKLRAWRDAARALPRLLRERAAIHDPGQGPGPDGAPRCPEGPGPDGTPRGPGSPGAQIDSARFAELLTAELDSEYLGPLAAWAPLSALLRAYWRLARRLLG